MKPNLALDHAAPSDTPPKRGRGRPRKEPLKETIYETERVPNDMSDFDHEIEAMSLSLLLDDDDYFRDCYDADDVVVHNLVGSHLIDRSRLY